MRYYFIFIVFTFSSLSLFAGGKAKYTKYYKQGRASWNKARYDEAINYLTRAEQIALSNNIKDSTLGYLHWYIANSYYSLKKYDISLQYFNKFENEYNSIGLVESPIVVNVFYEKGLLFKIKGDPDKEIDAYNIAYKQIVKYNLLNTNITPLVCNALGVIYIKNGEPNKAEKYLSFAVKSFESNPGIATEEYMSTLNNLAILYMSIGNYGKAETSFKKLIDYRKRFSGNNSLYTALAYNNLGTLYLNLFDYSNAISFFNQANAILSNSKNETWAALQNNFALIEVEKQNYNKAITYYQSAIDWRKENELSNQPAYYALLNNQGVAYLLNGELEKAESLINESASFRKKYFQDVHPENISSLVSRGLLAIQMKKFSDASAYFNAVSDKTLSFVYAVFPGLSENEKIGFVNNYSRYVDYYYKYAAGVAGYYKGNTLYKVSNVSKNKIYEDCYDIQLAMKGLVISGQKKIKNTILQSDNNELISLYKKWEFSKNKIATLNHQTQSQENDIKIKNLINYADSLEKVISLFPEVVVLFKDNKKVNWKEVQNALSIDDAAIEIKRVEYFDDTIYLAMILTKEMDAPKVVVIPKGKAIENRNYHYYKNNIKLNNKDELSYLFYWKDIDNELKRHGKIKTIYFSADGVYQQINVNTIYNPLSKKYLVDEYDIRSVLSTKDILKESKPTKPTQKLSVIIGNPDFRLNNKEDPKLFNGTVFSDLDGAGKEIESISSILKKYHWDVLSYDSQNASEENVKQILKPKLLHMATHGYFYNAKSRNKTIAMLNSGLVFSGVNAYASSDMEEDGILSGYEAMGLDLEGCDLVILSACETGLGNVEKGEGVVGLQRSIKIAGAQAMIVSLWQISDEKTLEFMQFFYQEYANNNDKYAAFSYAQRKLKEKYNDPYYWGAFLLIGDGK